MFKKTIFILAVGTMAAAFGATGAHAGGLLADVFIRPISPEAADAADGVHRQMGQPLDHTAIQIGTAVTGVPLGQFCGTPAGRFGPGPINPVGMPCNANTPWGPSFGQVVQ